MKSIIYARVSSKDQEETGYSLPAQRKFLEDYAKRKSFSVNKVFSISESASGKKQREVFTEMIRYAGKNNIKIIICEKVDRLTRNFKDAVIIDDWLYEDKERQVHLVKSSIILHKDSRSQQKLNWGVQLLFAKNTIDNLSEEVKKGQMEKIKQGWLPTKPPLGYKTIGESGHKIHVIDEGKSPFIEKIFKLYSTGNYSLKKLVEVMYKEGLRTKNGNKLVKSRLATLLADPFYCGKMRWNSVVYENGKQEPIISESLFNKVQSLLKSKTTPKYTKHFYLFRGLIRCIECGGTITWEKQKGIIYGHCNHYHSCSQSKWVKEGEIKEQIKKELSKLKITNSRINEWLKKALKEHHSENMNYRKNAINELNQRKSVLENRLSRIYEDYLDDRIKKSFHDKKFKEYKEELGNVDDQINRQSGEKVKYYEIGVNFYEISQRGPEIFNKAKNEDKRRMLNFIFKQIKLNEGILSYKYNKGFDILVKAIEEANGSKEDILNIIDDKNFEPVKTGTNKAKTGHNNPDFDKLLWR